LKVIKNTKDFFDQSLDEIKILELLRQTGQVQENHIVEMKCFFYYREHLVIVTELLRQNLFEFGKFILDNDEEPYFTISRLAYLTRQALISLRFVHNLGLVHSDVKPENVLLSSYSRAQIKLIDFGSSCYLTDRQSSYIQSRSYRAPEVVLGLPYDGRIDVWSLGCVVAEMFTGEVTFQNDSIVSMLSRIEAICGPFPRHMIAQGRQSGRFFSKCGLLYEVVDDSENGEGNKSAPGPHDDEDGDDYNAAMQFDIFQPKNTRLCARLGFDADLMDDFDLETYKTKRVNPERRYQQLFTDFVRRLLTVDPDGRPSADEALNHPWMQYAATLTEEEVKYPSS
jgi:dual specificity tyrosine-phosphorylation-regulated kinase 2/3/4